MIDTSSEQAYTRERVYTLNLKLSFNELVALRYALDEGLSNAEFDGYDSLYGYLRWVDKCYATDIPPEISQQVSKVVEKIFDEKEDIS